MDTPSQALRASSPKGRAKGGSRGAAALYNLSVSLRSTAPLVGEPLAKPETLWFYIMVCCCSPLPPKLISLPRAPLLGGLSPQVTGGLSRKLLLVANPTVIASQCHLSGLRLPAVASCKCTRTLLAAAPTTPPCFRHWRRSSLLPSRGGFGKEVELSAMPRAPLLGELSRRSP